MSATSHESANRAFWAARRESTEADVWAEQHGDTAVRLRAAAASRKRHMRIRVAEPLNLVPLPTLLLGNRLAVHLRLRKLRTR